MPDNQLFYGDNLDVLRRHIADESVDLIYLDPPFNSKQDYNVLFAEQDGTRSAAQIKAFGDTWRWDQGAEAACVEMIEAGGNVSIAIQALRTLLGSNDMMAYVAMMAPRLIELRRVLKPTGSIYLHCDPTASHYLKILMDAIFGPESFRNEIVWKRTSSHNDAKKFADINDCILYYRNSQSCVWNPQHVPHNENYLRTHYNRKDASGRRYRLDNIIRSASMGPRPNLVYEYNGFTPAWGWRMVRTKLEAIDKAGRLAWSESGQPYLVRFLDEMKGAAMPSLWDDIPPLNSQAAERLGYPTQKPEALLDRVIQASSNEGDVVLDPFCGCGTATASAQRLNRKWIGIDITHLAISLIKHRLADSFGEAVKTTYEVTGEPTDVAGARKLAASDPYQFQWWALGLVHARPVDQKKGADKGVDGRLFFHEGDTSKTKQIVFSVKSGHTGPAHIRDLAHVVDREKAAIGVLLTMQATTKPMRTAAAEAGFYESTWGQKKHPRVQILTIKELLEGKTIDAPPMRQIVTFKKAPKAKAKKTTHQPEMFDEHEEIGDDE